MPIIPSCNFFAIAFVCFLSFNSYMRMDDFQFLQNPVSKKWVILAPRRAKRPDVAKGMEPVCPFCPGREGEEEELYRVSENSVNSDNLSIGKSEGQSVRISEFSDYSDKSDLSGGLSLPSIPKTTSADWLVRVVPNKYPFAPIHEIIIHSPDHHKNFGELPLNHVELILQTYRQRFNTHKDKGQVYIFHNRGEGGGESLPHPHTQLAVVDISVRLDIPRLASDEELAVLNEQEKREVQETLHFTLFCPFTSQWPDEVWVVPKVRGRLFGEITDEEIKDLSHTLSRLIRIMDLRHGQEFPFNFYIYPGGDWYLRFIPRQKSLGGFEIGTGIFVNTQNPKETIEFIKTHFESPDEEKIKKEHQAEYGRHV